MVFMQGTPRHSMHTVMECHRPCKTAIRTVLMLFVLTLAGMPGACIRAISCGDGYCSPDYYCTQTNDGEPQCRARNHCGDGMITPEAGEICDRAYPVSKSCMDL